MIDFLRAWSHDDGALLVHCVAGISRSMAVALIALVVKAGGRELEAAQVLRNAAPHAWPNTRMVALADQILGCGGRLVAAREAMGPATLDLADAARAIAALGLTPPNVHTCASPRRGALRCRRRGGRR